MKHLLLVDVKSHVLTPTCTPMDSVSSYYLRVIKPPYSVGSY